MTRISSYPILLRWFFPLGMYAALGSATLNAITDGTFWNRPEFILVLIALAAMVFFLGRSQTRNLVDAVFDCGDYLLAKKGREEERIPLTNIWDVDKGTRHNSWLNRIYLAHPGKFGAAVDFSPAWPSLLKLFARDQTIKELKERVRKLGVKHAPGWSPISGTDFQSPAD